MCLFGRGDIRTRTLKLELLASFLSVHTSRESSVHKAGLRISQGNNTGQLKKGDLVRILNS